MTDLLHLQVAQMPRCPDLAIFVLTDKRTDGQNHLLTLHARRVINLAHDHELVAIQW
jgi:hypothetical protein